MSELVTYLTLIFVTSSVLLFILGQLSHPSIPAYILAGLFLGLFLDGAEVLHLAQLGIIFLVFLFGIRTEQDRISALTDESMGITLAQVTIVAGIVYFIAYSFGANSLNAMYLSIAAALSSSLIGLGLVEEELQMNLLHGRLTESINLMQDLIGIFLILAVTTTPFELYPILVNILYGAGIIVGAILVRDKIFPIIGARAEGSRELLMLTGITVLIGFIFITEYLGISLIVGAFAAGMVVSKYPYKLEMMDIMGSLKDFFSVIFFVILGMLVTLSDVRTLLIAASLIGITTLVKPGLIIALLMKNGYDSRTAFLTSMGMDHVSEFSLILAIQALVAGTIYPQVFQAIILAAVITMIVSTYTSRHAEKLYRVMERLNVLRPNYAKLSEKTHIQGTLEDHIILVGYGVQGKMIAEHLRRAGETFVVIDNDPEEVIEASRTEQNTVFGNVMDSNTWDRANAEEARLIVSTIPQKHASAAILSVGTEAEVILRAQRFGGAEELLEEGAMYVDVPDLMAADQLSAIVRGMLTNEHYAEELRRRNLLELRSYFYSSNDDEQS